jgi:hypothetical protein
LAGNEIIFAINKNNYSQKNNWYENKNEIDSFFKDLDCNLSIHYAVSLSVWKAFISLAIISKDIFTDHFVSSLDSVCGHSNC